MATTYQRLKAAITTQRARAEAAEGLTVELLAALKARRDCMCCTCRLEPLVGGQVPCSVCQLAAVIAKAEGRCVNTSASETTRRQSRPTATASRPKNGAA